jgi:acyl-CoA synthetase (AMP-forming)/AMP-acid ligase II
MEQAEERYGVPMVEAYGMTEATHQMTSNPLPPGRRLRGSVGVPAGAQIWIVDASWNDVAPDVLVLGSKAYSLPGLAPRIGELLRPGAAEIAAQNGIRGGTSTVAAAISTPLRRER